MGCNTSVHVKVKMGRSEKAIKAALLIQRWYRRSMVRLEARRRTSWAIFQSIEYAGEQDQLKLSKFFNTMLEQFSLASDRQTDLIKAFNEHRYLHTQASNNPILHIGEEYSKLLKFADPKTCPIEGSYQGPILRYPITRDQIRGLVTAFREKKVLHIYYLLELLHKSRRVLMVQPNIKRVSTFTSGQATVCGDLHGNFDDLYVIFQKNGLPGADNPYIFNGDFVDRGTQSVEVMILLLACLVYSPNHLHLNRGNHEDPIMNIRYGFRKEIFKKYKRNSMKAVRMFQEVFSWLPLCTIVDDDVLVVHGGLSNTVDLDLIEAIQRRTYVSVLRPPNFVNVGPDEMDKSDVEEWKQVLDILWSDPRDQNGCFQNSFRGGGCYFGPDVTANFLESNSLRLLIRSHECKREGYEYTHDGKVLTIFSASNYYEVGSNKSPYVLTIFSASNYYEVGSNKGAYVKVLADREGNGSSRECHVVQFTSSTNRVGRRLTFTERISHLEASALNRVRELIITNRTELEQEFELMDPQGTGVICTSSWVKALESVINIDVPWTLLQSRLVQVDEDEDGMTRVFYATTFLEKRVSILHTQPGGPSVTESLYRHKDILETIFRAFDMDSSGRISMTEFSEACQILIEHSNIRIQPTQILDIARSLDLNKDGYIDFNEFLEAFRIVDSQDRRRSAAMFREDSPWARARDLSPTHALEFHLDD